MFAGEHVNPSFFGYMEGAFQSGLLALGHIAEASGLFRYRKVVNALDTAVDAGWGEPFAPLATQPMRFGPAPRADRW